MSVNMQAIGDNARRIVLIGRMFGLTHIRTLPRMFASEGHSVPRNLHHISRIHIARAECLQDVRVLAFL